MDRGGDGMVNPCDYSCGPVQKAWGVRSAVENKKNENKQRENIGHRVDDGPAIMVEPGTTNQTGNWYTNNSRSSRGPLDGILGWLVVLFRR